MGIPEPRFVAKRSDEPNGFYDFFIRYIVVFGLLLIFIPCWWFCLRQSSTAHDLPRAVNRPAREYEILLFTGEKMSQVYPAQSYKITNFNDQGQLLQFSSAGVQHVYSGPFLVKEKR